MWKWLKNKGTAVVQAIAPDNIKSKLSVFALNHAPTGILSKLPTLETALIKNVVLGPNAHERSLSIARPLVKRLINHWHKDDKRRLEQIFGRYTRHYPDLESFLFCSELAEYTNELQSNKQPVIERKNTIAGFLAKKSSDFLRSYIFHICNESHTSVVENSMVHTSFRSFLEFKGINQKVFKIIKSKDLNRTHGIEFLSATHHAVNEEEQTIIAQIAGQVIPKSQEFMLFFLKSQKHFGEFNKLVGQGLLWSNAVKILNKNTLDPSDFDPSYPGDLKKSPKLGLIISFADALRNDLKNINSELSGCDMVEFAHQFIDHVDRLALKHMAQTLCYSAA